MSKELTPKYCPACGKALRMQPKPFCSNRQCGNFGKIIALQLEAQGVAVKMPASDNQPLALADRQVSTLLDNLVPCAPTDFYGDLARASKRQIDSLSEVMSTLSAIEKDLRNIPMDILQRDHATADLNRIACWVQNRAETATRINTLATEVVCSDFERLTALETAVAEAKKAKALLLAEKAQLEANLKEVNNR